ncbi:hypothetical protein BGZ97_002242 [Linnemannia gamsii]|uniref:Heat shock protein 70 n=1 Tax=Linnemannia gamsii TaxID=64522 RepID=A0A9P6RIG4_9FUNG|nr:hypothetical protein BGZ97_002242 [Linnemannia gamsii]
MSAGTETDKLVLGIELGNTYSRVGVYRNNRFEIIPNELGQTATPTMVAYTSDGRILVGQAAKDQQADNPRNTIFDLISLFNAHYFSDEIVAKKPSLPFELWVDPSFPETDRLYIRMENIKGYEHHLVLYPDEILVEVARKLKEDAERYLGRSVSKAVMAVPLMFDDLQRLYTYAVGKKAGLSVLRVVDVADISLGEYTFGKDVHEERNVIVADLGGSSFHGALVTCDEMGGMEMQVSQCISKFGGADFDSRVVAYWVEQFKRRAQQQDVNDITRDFKAMTRLRHEAEKAKIALYSSTSGVTSIKVEIKSLFKGQDFNETLTRTKFEDLNQDLFWRVIEVFPGLLDECMMEREDITDIVLAGGSIRIPRIVDILKETFGVKEVYDSSKIGVKAEEVDVYHAAYCGYRELTD